MDKRYKIAGLILVGLMVLTMFDNVIIAPNFDNDIETKGESQTRFASYNPTSLNYTWEGMYDNNNLIQNPSFTIDYTAWTTYGTYIYGGWTISSSGYYGNGAKNDVDSGGNGYAYQSIYGSPLLNRSVILYGALWSNVLTDSTNYAEIELKISIGGTTYTLIYLIKPTVFSDNSTTKYFLIGSSISTWYYITRNVTLDLFNKGLGLSGNLLSIYLRTKMSSSWIMYFDSLFLGYDKVMYDGKDVYETLVGNSVKTLQYPVNDSTTGTRAWGFPSYIISYSCVEDGFFAGVQTSGLSRTEYTYYLKATQFGFSIPSNATISSIYLQIKKRSGYDASGSYCTDNIIKLVKAGIINGTNNADTVTHWTTTAGGAWVNHVNNSWGNAWSVAQINAVNFGVAISAKVVSGSSYLETAMIDCIKITVYYTQNHLKTNCHRFMFNSFKQSGLEKYGFDTDGFFGYKSSGTGSYYISIDSVFNNTGYNNKCFKFYEQEAIATYTFPTSVYFQFIRNGGINITETLWSNGYDYYSYNVIQKQFLVIGNNTSSFKFSANTTSATILYYIKYFSIIDSDTQVPNNPRAYSPYYNWINGNTTVKLQWYNITWNLNASMDKFHVQFAQDESFTVNINNSVVDRSLLYKLISTSNGIYYWHVRCNTSGGVYSTWSNTMMFRIEPMMIFSATAFQSDSQFSITITSNRNPQYMIVYDNDSIIYSETTLTSIIFTKSTVIGYHNITATVTDKVGGWYYFKSGGYIVNIRTVYLNYFGTSDNLGDFDFSLVKTYINGTRQLYNQFTVTGNHINITVTDYGNYPIIKTVRLLNGTMNIFDLGINYQMIAFDNKYNDKSIIVNISRIYLGGNYTTSLKISPQVTSWTRLIMGTNYTISAFSYNNGVWEIFNQTTSSISSYYYSYGTYTAGGGGGTTITNYQNAGDLMTGLAGIGGMIILSGAIVGALLNLINLGFNVKRTRQEEEESKIPDVKTEKEYKEKKNEDKKYRD